MPQGTQPVRYLVLSPMTFSRYIDRFSPLDESLPVRRGLFFCQILVYDKEMNALGGFCMRSVMRRQVLIYENMIGRLERKSRVYNFLLIYYSIILIAYSLVAFIFSKAINPYLLPFCNIMISVVMLIFSVINNLANYQERIKKISKSKEEIEKTLVNEGDSITNEAQLLYHQIVNNTEKASQEDINAVDKENTSFNGLFRLLLYLLLVIVPLIILVECIYWPKFNGYYMSPYYWTHGP
jgi:hypothetical protein